MKRALRDRIGFFVERGLADAVPSPWQVKVGWLAMLPVTLGESPRERVLSRQTWLGQVPVRVPLQVLYNPRQLWVDTGLTHTATQTVRHLLSVFHEDAFLGYDLQLLHSHPGGLARLRTEAKRVADARSRWAPMLRRVVGDPGYHARLIGHAERAESFDYPDPRDLDPRFSSLVGFASFCCTMPEWPEAGFYGFDRRPVSAAAPSIAERAEAESSPPRADARVRAARHDDDGDMDTSVVPVRARGPRPR